MNLTMGADAAQDFVMLWMYSPTVLAIVYLTIYCSTLLLVSSVFFSNLDPRDSQVEMVKNASWPP